MEERIGISIRHNIEMSDEQFEELMYKLCSRLEKATENYLQYRLGKHTYIRDVDSVYASCNVDFEYWK